MCDPMTPWAEGDIAQLRYRHHEADSARRKREALGLYANYLGILRSDRVCRSCGHTVCSCSWTERIRRSIGDCFTYEQSQLAWNGVGDDRD